MLPFESVARDRIRYDCGLVALKSKSNRRQVKLAFSPLNLAGIHVAPLSVEISTLVMSFSPAHANPPTAILPRATAAPAAGVVISDLTARPLSGSMSFASTAAPGATRWFGYR